MYPISGGFETAEARIRALHVGGHHAEGLVTSVFTFEKSVRRGLRYLALARGFRSEHADLLFDNYGFAKLDAVWPCFDRDSRVLNQFVGQNWQHAKSANKMRNMLVHGNRVYELDECESKAKLVMEAVRDFRDKFIEETRVDVWNKLPRRTNSTTVWDIDWHKPQQA